MTVRLETPRPVLRETSLEDLDFPAATLADPEAMCYHDGPGTIVQEQPP
ncbi:MAG: hypothetical protein ABSG86_23230 [Thermoguttaceae bacterium]|jgi:RimJ/RimL family protein N-acetyltransferase